MDFRPDYKLKELPAVFEQDRFDWHPEEGTAYSHFSHKCQTIDKWLGGYTVIKIVYIIKL